MAINTLEYAKIFQTELDKKMLETATSAWMESNAGQVKYNGGDEVRIPTISLVGLGDYDRDNGYKQGAVTLGYETRKMTMDRGRAFMLDAMDVDETNFVVAAGMVMGEFQRIEVVPEVDAYRYSAIYKAAGADHQTTYTAAAASIMDSLDADITAIQDEIGDTEPLVVIISRKVHAILNAAKNVDRYINVAEFQNGAVSTKVKTFNDIPLLDVPSARFKSAYTFDAGATKNAGGFAAADGAVDMNWIVIARRAPIAVSKQDKVRIFTPDTYQNANAWKLDYRKYHDLWIKDNALDAVRVNAPAKA
ncbi:hypothetical protein SAMN02910343_00662 [Dialister histaminiformans]|uniref:Phage major capsid protein, HK97 family n=1 Tax=Allisonella histaminiformans TaxID=209880 RepID=A0A1G5VIE3_9FIRM|nr:hypothetical protein [Allisonella histaminiformans]SDA45619.1 hypothetical protein SAMN02910343_00662 [Allisonella histaminiformans]